MRPITQVQTGVRIESRILKVLKRLADSLDMSLGDLLEGIVLHAFEGKAPFTGRSDRGRLRDPREPAAARADAAS